MTNPWEKVVKIGKIEWQLNYINWISLRSLSIMSLLPCTDIVRLTAGNDASQYIAY